MGGGEYQEKGVRRGSPLEKRGKGRGKKLGKGNAKPPEKESSSKEVKGERVRGGGGCSRARGRPPDRENKKEGYNRTEQQHTQGLVPKSKILLNVQIDRNNTALGGGEKKRNQYREKRHTLRKLKGCGREKGR